MKQLRAASVALSEEQLVGLTRCRETCAVAVAHDAAVYPKNPTQARIEVPLFTGLPEQNALVMDAQHPHTKLLTVSMSVPYQSVSVQRAMVVITGDKLISEKSSKCHRVHATPRIQTLTATLALCVSRRAYPRVHAASSRSRPTRRTILGAIHIAAHRL